MHLQETIAWLERDFGRRRSRRILKLTVGSQQRLTVFAEDRLRRNGGTVRSSFTAERWPVLTIMIVPATAHAAVALSVVSPLIVTTAAAATAPIASARAATAV